MGPYWSATGSAIYYASGPVFIGTGTKVSADGALQISGYNQVGGSTTGYHQLFEFKNTYASATTPKKFVRLNSSGTLEWVNDAYSTVIMNLTDAGALTTTGNMNAPNFVLTSDARLKENIEPLGYGLDTVKSFRPVSYVMKKTGEAQIGLIAQEVKSLVPEVVRRGPDNSLGITYDNLIAVLIKATQELDSKVTALSEKIQNLELHIKDQQE